MSTVRRPQAEDNNMENSSCADDYWVDEVEFMLYCEWLEYNFISLFECNNILKRIITIINKV